MFKKVFAGSHSLVEECSDNSESVHIFQAVVYTIFRVVCMVDVCYTVFASMYFEDLKQKTLTKTKILYIKSKIALLVFVWVQSDLVSQKSQVAFLLWF